MSCSEKNGKTVLIKDCISNGRKVDVLIEGKRISKISDKIEVTADKTIEAKGLTLLPAFVDIHTHLREPGFEGKEDIKSGSRASVNGGYASVCCMPNTKPVTDSAFVVKYILDRAREADMAKVYPIGAVSVGLEGKLLAEIGKMKEAGVVALSDDGMPVENSNLMKLGMTYANDFGLKITSHCEDKSLVDGGVVNEGKNATIAGLKGICRSAEEVMIARDLVLAKTLDLPIHIAHVSTAGGVQLIRNAKKDGIKVTCETCPHYYSATDDLILNYDTNAKVNPPLREESDRLAIIEGIKDGTIDAIATDHAPHKASEKAGEFNSAMNGISGIETAYALSYTYLVKAGHISLDRLSELMSKQPAEVFGLAYGEVREGGLADLVLVENENDYKIDKTKFESKGKNTPFDGWEVYGKVVATIVEGSIKKDKGEVL